MNIFLHICCAPCSVACIQQLREEGHPPTGFWYNPNIHPFLEYKARRDTLRQYAQDIDLPLVELDDYGLRQFTAAVAANSDARCSWCYARRFEETAKTAAQRGFSAFTSTLLISPYQNRELMCEIGEKVGKKGVVREKSTHHEVIEKVADYAVSIGFRILAIDFSPIRGPEGNIEYLIHLRKCPTGEAGAEGVDLESVVDRAFETLAK